METPIYITINSHPNNEYREGVLHIPPVYCFYKSKNEPIKPVYYIELSEVPINNSIVLMVDSEDEEIHLGEKIFSQLIGLELDKENHCAYLGANNVMKLPEEITLWENTRGYGRWQRNRDEEYNPQYTAGEFAAYIWGSFHAHYKIYNKFDVDSFDKEKIDTDFLLGFLDHNHFTDWWYAGKWFFVKFADNQIEQIKSFSSLKSASKYAKKYIKENYNEKVNPKWYRDEVFVKDNEIIRIIKESPA
jgi:hypothetical protein